MSKGPPFTIIRRDERRHPLRDFYHWLMTISWPRLSVVILGAFITANVFFAVLYLVAGDVIQHARPGNFGDAFFFSVQTMATIGYGQMIPAGLYANLLATVEAMLGLLGFAMAAGLMFSKFSRPTAKVMYSRHAVITPRDGVPCLIFRMANERRNRILEANLTLVLARDEQTKEGEAIRRMLDLKLARSRTPNFALTWVAWHPILPDSPLYGMSQEDWERTNAEVIVTLSGIDDTFSQTVYSRYSYNAADLRWNHRFRDVFLAPDPKTRVYDLALFHETESVTEK